MQSLNLILERQMGNYSVSSDPVKLDLSFIHNWLANESYWEKDIPIQLNKRKIENSFCFGVYHDNGEQVGFCRVITDFTVFAWIADVFIIKEHRGKGLSKFLLKTVMDHPELRIIRHWMLCTKDAQGLYQKLGFNDLDDPKKYLTIKHNNMYQSSQYDDLIKDFLEDLK